ncbi:MAG TPA: cupin domain-containing protein [Vineibacter sp.]|nr:cupin domain-containing protein [Vineibacter sp.]
MKQTRAKPADIHAALAALPALRNRGPQTPEHEVQAAFARLSETRDGAVYAGRFDGQSAWERHPNGDELVQVLAGETQLTILTPDGPSVLRMTAGMLVIVPQGWWHRFHAPTGVTVLTMTPAPTEHSTAEDPTGA